MRMFSVIVPVYNVEKYLAQCIESLLAQTFADYELILVDDGSKDASGQICDDYRERDSRIRVIHKPNGGLVSARKAGILECTGKYVLNVDSDDYIASDLLMHIFSAVQKSKPDVVAYGHTKVAENGTLIAVCYETLDAGYYDAKSIHEKLGSLLYDFEQKNHNTGCISYSIWSKAVKRELLLPLQLRVPDQVRCGEDLAMTMPLMCKINTLTVLPYAGYFYRQRASSMVNAFDPGEAERICVLIAYLETCNLRIPIEKIQANTVRMLLGEVTKAAIFYKKFKDFRYYADIYCRERLQLALKVFRHKKLKLSSKIRIWILKRECWSVFWVVCRLKDLLC